VIKTVAVLPIRLYQLLVSPFVPANTCKYHPSCSEYAVLAIKKHGVVKGVTLAGWILLTAAWVAILGLTGWCVARVLRADDERRRES